MKLRGWLTRLALVLLGVCVLEGAASWLLLSYDLARNAELVFPERKHTLHDDELGWVNQKHVRAPNLYAEGRHLHTNSMGVRGQAEISALVPVGKRRVLCFGDSFTLGYGVSDEHTFPAQLQRLRPEWEVVNFGQGGYGIDQAYLWYLRDGLPLEHHVHVFAFIADDFERMRLDSFSGYAKPMLALDGEPGPDRSGLALRGVPVPKGTLRAPWWTQNAKLFERLRSLQLLRMAGRRLGWTPASGRRLDHDQAREIATRVFADLARLHAARGSRLVLVLLPNLDPSDDLRLVRLAPWMQSSIEAARARGIEVLDLTPDFEALEPLQRAALFLARGVVPFPGARGHYSEAGNEFVARILHQRL